MKRFTAPLMEIQRLASEDLFTSSDCRTEAQGCTSCYCSGVGCDGCYTQGQTCTSDCFDHF